jgi:hypothetical protein
MAKEHLHCRNTGSNPADSDKRTNSRQVPTFAIRPATVAAKGICLYHWWALQVQGQIRAMLGMGLNAGTVSS